MVPTAELIERLWPEGYRVARSILRDHAAAEDAVQEACVRLYTSFDRIRDENSLDRWFFRVVVRECYAHLRYGKRQAAYDETWVSPAPDGAAQSLDLRTAIGALPVTQRLAVIFRYYYGFGDAEIADILQTSHPAIRVRLFMARRALRKALDAAPPLPTVSKHA
jgi:RNA polymerase sigma-70 factor (ECF subfamily)